MDKLSDFESEGEREREREDSSLVEKRVIATTADGAQRKWAKSEGDRDKDRESECLL